MPTGLNTITRSGHDTSINTGTNYNIGGVGAGFRITAIDVAGAFQFDSTLFAGSPSTSVFITYVLAGIQIGNSGYTPVAINAGRDDTNWLVQGQIAPAASIAAWAPGTDSGLVLDRYPFTMRFRGQFFLANTSDVYFSTGEAFSGNPGWILDFTSRITYN